MTPSSERRPTALALLPPQDMGEALMPYLESMPELRTAQHQAVFRQKFIMLINAAMQNPGYRKERRVQRPPDHDRSFHRESSSDRDGGIIVPNTVVTHERHDDIGKEYASLRVSDDFCLGLSYIQQRRGDEAVRNYLRANDIEKIVLIGKQVRTEQGQKAHEAFVERNSFMYTDKSVGDTLPIRGLLSGAARDLVPDPPSIITHTSTIAQWQAGIDEADAYLRFGEEQFGLNPRTCADAVKNLKMKEYFSFMLEIVFLPSGCLELAVFNAAFGHRHGSAPTKHFILPAELYPAFRDSFTYDPESTRWSFRNEEVEALEAACAQLFPDNARATTLLQYSLRILIDNANASAKLRHSKFPDDSEIRIQRLFPSPDAQRKVEGRTVNRRETKTLTAYDIAIKADKKAVERRQPFRHTAQEILALDATGLRALARRYPAGIEWHTLLLDATPDQVGQILGDLFDAEDIVCSGVAAELTVLLLAMDIEIFNSFVSIIDILDPEAEETKKFLKSSSQLQAVFKHLSSDARFYCRDYCIMTRYVENNADDIDDEDEGPIEDLKEGKKSGTDVEQEDSGKNESIIVTRLMENYSEGEGVLPVFHTKYWHRDLGATKTLTVSQVLVILRDTPLPDLEKTVGHLVERRHCITEEIWMRVLDEIYTRKSEFVEDNPKLLRTLLGCIPPELIAGPLLVLQYQDVEAAMLKFLEKQKVRPPIDALDLPVDFFVESGGQDVASHKAWVPKGVFSLASEELRQNSCDFALEHGDESVREQFPFLFIKKGVNHVFTTLKKWTAKDLPAVAALCMKEGHGLMKPIIRKALASSAAIQEQLLTDTLPAPDAGKLACAMLGDLARKSSDARKVGGLELATWATRTSPPLDASAYGILLRAFKKRPALYMAFIAALKGLDGEVALADL